MFCRLTRPARKRSPVAMKTSHFLVFVLGLAIGAMSLGFVVQRFAFVPTQAAPLLYRCDRLTGRTWVTSVKGYGSSPRWLEVQEPVTFSAEDAFDRITETNTAPSR